MYILQIRNVYGKEMNKQLRERESNLGKFLISIFHKKLMKMMVTKIMQIANKFLLHLMDLMRKFLHDCI